MELELVGVSQLYLKQVCKRTVGVPLRGHVGMTL